MSIKQFFIALFLVFTAAIALAQKNAIRVQPLDLIWGKLSAQYERLYAPQSSFTVEFQRWDMNRTTKSRSIVLERGRTSREITVKGYSIELMHRSYFRPGFEGFYFELGPHLSKYDLHKRETTTTKEWGSSGWLFWDLLIPTTKKFILESDDNNNVIIGMKGGLGYHKRRDGVDFDFAAGPRWQSSGGYQLSGDPIKPLSLYLRAGIGIAF